MALNIVRFSNLDDRLGNKWTPEKDLSIFEAWFDASDTSTITQITGAVSQINDKSGNGRHLKQSTGASQPTTGSRTINGLNVLDHNGSQLMITDSFSWPTSGNLAVFMVAKIDAVDNANDGIFGSTDDNGTNNYDFDIRSANATAFNGQLFADNIGVSQNLSGGPFSGPSIYNANLNWDSSILNAYVDGTKRTSDGTYSTKFHASGKFVAFAKANNNAQKPDGAWAEIIMIEDLIESTRQKIEGYLAWKWGLINNIPSNHPYKLSPPLG